MTASSLVSDLCGLHRKTRKKFPIEEYRGIVFFVNPGFSPFPPGNNVVPPALWRARKQKSKSATEMEKIGSKCTSREQGRDEMKKYAKKGKKGKNDRNIDKFPLSC
jgi:hypothetical protein